MYTQEIREMNAIRIQALVRNMDESFRRHKKIRATNPAQWRSNIEAENSVLLNECPTIFDMHMEGKLDETFFFMLQQRRKIETGELTEEEASKIVGQKLFDRYVAPVVSNLPAPEPALSYSEYYKRVSNAPD